MRKPLTSAQKKIYDYVVFHIESQGCSPTIREICAGIGLNSPSTVQKHLSNMRQLGYFEGTDGKKRSREIQLAGTRNNHVSNIPIMGAVAAGAPLLAHEDIEGYLPYPTKGPGDYFALRIRGDSMEGAGILSGDIVVVQRDAVAQHNDIVIALLEDEATCKRLNLDDPEHIKLMPENPKYEPIDGTDCTILGVVKGLNRDY